MVMASLVFNICRRKLSSLYLIYIHNGHKKWLLAITGWRKEFTRTSPLNGLSIKHSMKTVDDSTSKRVLLKLRVETDTTEFHDTLVHEINASLNCAIFGKIAQIKWLQFKCRKVLVRTN